MWSQYPLRPNVGPSVTHVPSEFVGRNAIVWTLSGGGGIEEFVIKRVDGMTVHADRPLNASDECHFTLDATYAATNDVIIEGYSYARDD
jgi:hypothetical protein